MVFVITALISVLCLERMKRRAADYDLGGVWRGRDIMLRIDHELNVHAESSGDFFVLNNKDFRPYHDKFGVYLYPGWNNIKDPPVLCITPRDDPNEIKVRLFGTFPGTDLDFKRPSVILKKQTEIMPGK